MSGTGRLVAFEGGEGSGKSTQIRLLAAWLEARGSVPLVTREPGGTPGGQALRQLLLTGPDDAWSAPAETLLMVADRAEHLDKIIRPALREGRLVLTDRYVGSTLAYQGAGRGVDPRSIRALHRDFCGDLWPDLTIVLDVDPRIGLARSKRRLLADASGEARFESLDLGFHERVRRGFLDLATNSERSVVIDAASGPDAVQSAVRLALAGLGQPEFGGSAVTRLC